MTAAKNGDTVKIHYTGKLNDGNVFDSSLEKDPLEFKVGDNQVIEGFEEAVIGMSPMENKTTTIPSDKAYGEYRDDMVIEVDKAQFPDNIDPEVGQQLELRQENGQKVVVSVADVNDSAVTLDANHPLAGKDLTFEIQLLEIA
ncbi:MAG: peptidylprolyl isomerase [Deltaproteobacteria bacterium]|nr:peptidylprolyl isomerase [Deltaproteobacteria bacterium]